MKLQMSTIGFLLLFGAASQGSSPAAGAKYEHKIESSSFKLGTGEHAEVEGPYERLAGDRGAFSIDTMTGATLAVLNAPRSGVLPRPLTQNPEEHSVRVRSYLTSAGIPEDEVSGMHVTTTMAGGGPANGGVEPSRSTLLFYTTHLERSLQGIPVEGSYAFAALDSDGEVITEGVYWPAIPASVVREAQQLKQKLDSPMPRAAFLANVETARPDAKEAAGEVKIVHTSGRHHGSFEARAVYSTVVRGAIRGKAAIVRFDDQGTPTTMGDEKPTATDSVKR